MQSFQLSYKQSKINYYRFGHGTIPVICLHGYGEDAASFKFLEQLAEEQFSFFALDLPFHGKTDWQEGLKFSQEDLCSIVNEIRAINQIVQRSYFIVGFSLGARVSLCLYQSRSPEIDKLVLLAPDGLKLNFWYWLSTQTWFGNKLFRFTMDHPRWFLWFLQLLNRLGWVNSSIFKFVNFYIGDSSVRNALYKRWTGLRKLKPDIAGIKSLVKTRRTPVRLIYGKHDRIILPGRGKKFIEGIEPCCKLMLINSGHQVLHEKHSDEILAALMQ